MLLVHEYACFPLDLPYLAAERSWVQKTSGNLYTGRPVTLAVTALATTVCSQTACTMRQRSARHVVLIATHMFSWTYKKVHLWPRPRTGSVHIRYIVLVLACYSFS